MKKKVGFKLSGKHYGIELEEAFADFIEDGLQEAGISMSEDNEPQKLFLAYLQLAKKTIYYEEEIEVLEVTLDSI